MLGAALLIVALALLFDAVFALLQRVVVPRGVTAGRSKDFRAASSRRRAVVGSPIEEGKG
jgi:osmoprotectant transport system permease protein